MQQINQMSRNVGEKPFGVGQSVATLMEQTANITSYQHICICTVCAALVSTAQKLHEGKVNTSASAAARPVCHA